MVEAAPVPTSDPVTGPVDRTAKNDKEKVVVLGSGWGALKFAQNIDTSKFDVTLVSPRNYFLFTPFLPSATVGSVETRSIVEPIRELLKFEKRPAVRKFKDRLNGVAEETFDRVRYFEAACQEVDYENNRVICADTSEVAGSDDAFTLSYDKLVVAVGATSNTFGTPGVHENALFLKEVEDAVAIRRRVTDAFETAAIQESDEEKAALLQFVVVGGGPTGLETAAELDDWMREDLIKLFPKEVALAKVTLVEAAGNVLNMYDQKIKEYTEELLTQTKVDLILNTFVTEVCPDKLKLKAAKTGEQYDIPSSMTMWSTGVTATPLVQALQKGGGDLQTKRNALETNRFLLARGYENVYAVGDCCAVDEADSMAEDMVELFLKADKDKSGSLEEKEVLGLFEKASSSFPQAKVYAANVGELFNEFDADGSNCIDQAEFTAMLKSVDSKLRSLPPTAQVAGQMGTYLAEQFNGENGKMFDYFHKGSMAYLGQNKAAASVSIVKNFLPESVAKLIPGASEDIILTGSLANVIWRFLYLDMLVSDRNKIQVGFDWIKAGVFGRDTSRY